MTVLSKVLAPSAAMLSRVPMSKILVRLGSGEARKFLPWQSTFIFQRIRDHYAFYTFVTTFPFVAIVLYTHIFYGPCELRPIPEGYEPEHWQYEKHPITQFIARYLTSNPQKQHEKILSILEDERDNQKWRDIERRVRHLMYERQDYKAWWYRPFSSKWVDYNLITRLAYTEVAQPFSEMRDFH